MMRLPGNTTQSLSPQSGSPFRQTLQSAMPKLLTNGHKTPKEETRELIDAVKPKALRERMLKVWARL